MQNTASRALAAVEEATTETSGVGEQNSRRGAEPGGRLWYRTGAGKQWEGENNRKGGTEGWQLVKEGPPSIVLPRQARI